MGLVKAKLIKKENVYVHDRWFPSTKVCYICGCVQEHLTLADRTFTCKDCGHSEDRDVKAAKTMMVIGQMRNIFVPRESRDVKPVEIDTSRSVKQEDTTSLA